MTFREKFIGDKSFYKKMLAIAVPVMIQMGITNFVSLLDNIMVGRLGTDAMSGVSIVNQFIFIFNLLIFGALSGAGIFSVQYYGNRDTDGVRYAFRFKVLIGTVLTLLTVGVFLVADDALISSFLYSGGSEGNMDATFAVGKEYLSIMLIGLLPYTFSQIYALSLRETEQTVVPMVASIVAVVTNFVLNGILIFGLCGAPALGARGAAIATVIARFCELAVLLVWSHTHTERCPFLKGAYRSLYIPKNLFFRIALKSMPMMGNELLWSLSITLRNQCYATRGLDVVAAQNICSTIVNLFSVFYMSVGHVVGIIVGGLLGAGLVREAKDANRKLMVCSVGCGLLLGGMLMASSHLFPILYNTGEGVRDLAAYMMIVSGACMPFGAFAYSAYFAMRSGGRVGITFLMDSGYMWLAVLPVGFILSRLTAMPIGPLFFICQGVEVLKSFLIFFLLCRGTWANRLVGDGEFQKENATSGSV